FRKTLKLTHVTEVDIEFEAPRKCEVGTQGELMTGAGTLVELAAIEVLSGRVEAQFQVGIAGRQPPVFDRGEADECFETAGAAVGEVAIGNRDHGAAVGRIDERVADLEGTETGVVVFEYGKVEVEIIRRPPTVTQFIGEQF